MMNATETETVDLMEVETAPEPNICGVCGHDFAPFRQCPQDHRGLSAPIEGPFND